MQLATREERQWAMLCHVSTLLLYAVLIGGIGMPFALLSLLGPLAGWLLARRSMPFVAAQAKEALNFQILVVLGLVAATILMFVLVGFLIFWVLIALHFVMTVLAAVKVMDGVPYRYPFNWRVVR